MYAALNYPSNANPNGEVTFFDDQSELLRHVENLAIKNFPDNIMDMEGNRFNLEYREGFLTLVEIK